MHRRMPLQADYDLFAGPEHKLLEPFLRDPVSEETQRAYLAYLDADDPGRAAVLRLHLRLVAAPGTPDIAGLHAELYRQVETLGGPRITWWHIVRGRTSIRNCGAARTEPSRVRFAFHCPRTWESLDAGVEPEVRHCQDCQESVFRCHTVDEVASRARAGQCVFVPEAVQDAATSNVTSGHVGRPDPLMCWADAVFKGSE